MAHDPLLRIHDVLREIALLDDIASEHDRASFAGSIIACHAAAYAIQTISEAVRHIPEDWLAAYPDEPWAEIKAVGNKIRHE